LWTRAEPCFIEGNCNLGGDITSNEKDSMSLFENASGINDEQCLIFFKDNTFLIFCLNASILALVFRWP